MDYEQENAIRKRAFTLWVAAGRPFGTHLKFWFQAERELASEPLDPLQTGLEETFPASDPPASVLRTKLEK